MSPMTGRFAPSPTGDLHLGNLRTALIAWLAARSVGESFALRTEDLDLVAASDEHERSQQDDLRALGIDWDGPVWRQRDRFPVYREALAALEGQGLTYECFCSRREIRDAAAAPHGNEGLVYPGTCRDLAPAARASRRRHRTPAIRFRSEGAPIDVDDVVAGPFRSPPHDVVLCRNDGVPAYNLAVVVDDAAQGVDLVVRGDDLLPSTPTQVSILRALGHSAPRYAHVPLVVGEDGRRLAKRDGAITLAELAAKGVAVEVVRAALAVSIGVAEPGEPVGIGDLVGRFDLARFASRGRAPIRARNLVVQ
jgi:glutamyl-tRNA synthetase